MKSFYTTTDLQYDTVALKYDIIQLSKYSSIIRVQGTVSYHNATSISAAYDSGTSVGDATVIKNVVQCMAPPRGRLDCGFGAKVVQRGEC